MRRFLDTLAGDKNSTSNMRKHARHCWSDEVVKKADEARDELTLDNMRQSLVEAKKSQDGSIMAFFDRKGMAKAKYMIRQHTYQEARSVFGNDAIDRILTEKWFIVLNMFVGVPRVCAASGSSMIPAFNV